MVIRRFEVCDRQPHPSAIYGELFVHIDDTYEDNLLIDGTNKYHSSILELANWVAHQIRNSVYIRSIQFTCNTDTLHKILELLVSGGWRWTELSKGFLDRKIKPVGDCADCEGSGYHNNGMDSYKCFTCDGTGYL